MTLTKTELRAEIKSLTAGDFCIKHLFDDDAWIFNSTEKFGIEGKYQDFRAKLGKSLGVPGKDIAIVGSAKLGFSLSPGQDKPLLSHFNADSDIDTIIVSKPLFEDIWAQFKAAFYNGYDDIIERHGLDTFKGFVVLGNQFSYGTTFLRAASKQLLTARRDLQHSFSIDYPIKYRIYLSWTDAKNYHVWSIEKLRKRLFP